jgi:putative aldouronate transport system permease protein
MNAGTLYKTTDVIDTYVFRMLRVIGDTGMAAAAGFYQSIVGFMLIISANYLVRIIDKDKALF